MHVCSLFVQDLLGSGVPHATRVGESEEREICDGTLGTIAIGIPSIGQFYNFTLGKSHDGIFLFSTVAKDIPVSGKDDWNILTGSVESRDGNVDSWHGLLLPFYPGGDGSRAGCTTSRIKELVNLYIIHPYI